MLHRFLQDWFLAPPLHPAVRRCYEYSRLLEWNIWIEAHTCLTTCSLSLHYIHLQSPPLCWPSLCPPPMPVTQIPPHWHQSTDKRPLLINFRSVSYRRATPKQTCQLMLHLIFEGILPKIKREKGQHESHKLTHICANRRHRIGLHFHLSSFCAVIQQVLGLYMFPL